MTANRAPFRSGEVTGRAAVQPPVAYLPCRLDERGELAEVLMGQLPDGRTALLGYTALDRFVEACGDQHPWTLWRTEDLEELRATKHFDVAYLDAPLPPEHRQDGAGASS
jgi:hypothetical protein